MDKYSEFNSVRTMKDSIDYAKRATVSKIVTKNEGGSATLFSFDKGQTLSEHSTAFDAIAVIIDGQCVISIDGNPHNLSEGQMIRMPANIPHSLEATNSFKMLLTMFRS
jgi:quercetin dioxygenase-like cupin family protein